MPSDWNAYFRHQREQKQAEKRERRDGTCSECYGTGRVQIDYDDDGDPIYDTCPRCNGTGKIR